MDSVLDDIKKLITLEVTILLLTEHGIVPLYNLINNKMI